MQVAEQEILWLLRHMLFIRGGAKGVPGGPLPPQNFAWSSQWPPQNFPRDVRRSRSLSESPTQTIDSSPCYKTGPSSGPLK